MRRLSCGWDQACDSTLITGRKQLNSAFSQSHVNTVHTSYSQHCQWKIASHFKHSLVLEEHRWFPRPTPITKLIHNTFRMIIYTIHKWYRTAPLKRNNKKTTTHYCAFPYYCTVWWPQTKKKKEWVHSFAPDADKVFSRSSSMAVGRQWQTDNHFDYRTRQKVHNQGRYDTKWVPQCSLTALQSIWRFAYELLTSHYYYISAILE